MKSGPVWETSDSDLVFQLQAHPLDSALQSQGWESAGLASDLAGLAQCRVLNGAC